MVRKAFLLSVSSAHVSNTWLCNNEIILLLLLLQTWVMLKVLLKLLPVRLMPLLLGAIGLLACYNQKCFDLCCAAVAV